MTLTKTLLREELTIFNEKLKLTKETLILIENPDYVKYVLGINVSLNESQSFETKRLILQEALNLQSLTQSIKQYVGDKVDGVVESVNDIKDVLKIIYKIATDATGDLVKKAEKILKESIEDSLIRFKQAVVTFENKLGTNIKNFKPTLDGIITHVTTLVKKLENYIGLTGILAMLGFATLMEWVNQKVFSLTTKFETVIKIIKEAYNSFGDYFKQLFGNLTIDVIINYFKDFNNKLHLGVIAKTAEIIGIMARILRPILQRFNLIKRPTQPV